MGLPAMNVPLDTFLGAIMVNIEPISRTITTALDELGVGTPPSWAFAPSELELLGRGRWGIVFDTGMAGWLWKVTADPDEGPVVANIIANEQLRYHPGICFYGGVWRFRAAQRLGLEQLYLILREELIPVDEVEADFTPGEERADDLLDEIIWCAENLNTALDSDDNDYLDQAAEAWGTKVGELHHIAETTNVADFMLLFLRLAGGALADVHRSNCGVREDDQSNWVIMDPGVSRTHFRPRIPLVRNPGLPTSIPFLLP